MRIRSILTHSVQAVAEGALLSLLVVGLMVGTAFAAKGGNGNGQGGGSAVTAPSSITLNETNVGLGSSVTFSVVYPGSVKSPRIAVNCYQNSLVYGEAGPYDQTFLLGGGSSQWLTYGGPAQCTADLFYFVWNGNNPQQYYWLASTTFTAGG